MPVDLLLVTCTAWPDGEPGHDHLDRALAERGIAARWVVNYMKARGLEDRYLAWLQRNAQAAWNVRRQTDSVAWADWSQPTPATELYSWACSSAVVLLNVVPLSAPGR